jgi:membrane protein
MAKPEKTELNIPEKPATGLGKLDRRLSEHFRQVLDTLIVDLKATWRLGKKNDLTLLASSVSFYCIFSFLPMIILCFMVSHKLLGDHSHSPEALRVFFEALVPSMAPWIVEQLERAWPRTLFGDATALALIFWSTYDLFACLQNVFAKISVHGENRDFVGSNVIAFFCFVTVAFSSSVLMILFTTKAIVLRGFLASFPGGGFFLALSPIGISLFILYLSIACVLGSVTFMYKWLPIQKVSILNAFKGSLLFFGLVCAGRIAYQIYAKLNQAQSANLYGGLAIVFLAIIWIYYLSNIFMFAAQYVILLEEKPKTRKS